MMGFDSFGSKEDGEYNRGNSVGLSNSFSMNESIIIRKNLSDGVSPRVRWSVMRVPVTADARYSPRPALIWVNGSLIVT